MKDEQEKEYDANELDNMNFPETLDHMGDSHEKSSNQNLILGKKLQNKI